MKNTILTLTALICFSSCSGSFSANLLEEESINFQPEIRVGLLDGTSIDIQNSLHSMFRGKEENFSNYTLKPVLLLKNSQGEIKEILSFPYITDELRVAAYEEKKARYKKMQERRKNLEKEKSVIQLREKQESSQKIIQEEKFIKEEVSQQDLRENEILTSQEQNNITSTIQENESSESFSEEVVEEIVPQEQEENNGTVPVSDLETRENIETPAEENEASEVKEQEVEMVDIQDASENKEESMNTAENETTLENEEVSSLQNTEIPTDIQQEVELTEVISERGEESLTEEILVEAPSIEEEPVTDILLEVNEIENSSPAPEAVIPEENNNNTETSLEESVTE